MRGGLDSRRGSVTEGATEGLWREGDHWALRYRGRETRLKHAKGLGYLALLLEHAGAEIHVLEIVAAADGAPAPTGERPEPMADDAAGAGAGLDSRAKAAYRARVEELHEEIEQARDGRMTREWHGRERSWTSSLTSSPGRSGSAGATDPRLPRPSARARTSAARCTRPCARSRRRCPSSAHISSAPSTRARSARAVPTPSRPWRSFLERQRRQTRSRAAP